uniref:Uncharacterized protein n=1 Tax=Otus sunia TaxID=257818 RepID=A0A8C8B8V2_9STRI
MRKYLFVPNLLQIQKLGLMTPPHPPVRRNSVFYWKFRHLQRFLMTNKFYGGSARNWSTLDSVEIVQDGEKFAKFNVSVMSAPVEYSFHCQLVGTSNLYPGLHSMLNCTHLSTFLHFQIQGFNVENNQFSYASDCTGFFAPGIWMGLVISIVLLWILAYGIHMITQLTTNSRFDDPKGPALSVPQTE